MNRCPGGIGAYDKLNLVALGHKQLWRPLAANRLPLTQECCGLLRTQQTLAAFGGKTPYMIREMVTKIILKPYHITIMLLGLRLTKLEQYLINREVDAEPN